MNDYIKEWESKPEEIKKLTEGGVVPILKDLEDGKDIDIPFLMGQVSGVIEDIKPAKQIVEDMVREAVDMLRVGQSYLGRDSRL
jgi:hypothetical protein